MRSWIVGFLILSLVGAGRARAADVNSSSSTREFVMSCTYGVMAGTLVGAASLAFTKQPSQNMYRVARGASLGLYTGILLGLYVVYVVPGMEESGDDEGLSRIGQMPLQLTPLFGAQAQLDGLAADWTVLRF